MHDDQPGGVPQPHAKYDRVVLRHFDTPINLRDLLHSTLDRLLDEMVKERETMGAVAVTSMDSDTEFGGRTVLLALDLDPAAHEYEDWDEGGESGE